MTENNQSVMFAGCEKCDHGWIFSTDDKGHEFVKPCECQQVEKARIRLKNSGISEEFQKKDFKSYTTNGNPVLEKAKETAIDYFMNFDAFEKNRENSALFTGQPGSGKTHLSMAIANNLLQKKNVGVLYMPYRESITKIKQVVTDEYDYSREINPYKTARVLMIDDLFKGGIRESDINAMFEIINYRYLNNLPMIVSTEKTVTQLLEMDEATGSRIIEMCRGHIVQFNGKDLNYRIRR